MRQRNFAEQTPGRRDQVHGLRRNAGLMQQTINRAAISGVGSAGFATTALPAARAAVTCPAKIANGKFHGLMQANTPRPCNVSSLISPVGPSRRSGAANCLRARNA